MRHDQPTKARPMPDTFAQLFHDTLRLAAFLSV